MLQLRKTGATNPHIRDRLFNFENKLLIKSIIPRIESLTYISYEEENLLH